MEKEKNNVQTISISNLHLGDAGSVSHIVSDTAGVLAICESNESLLSPRGGPAVSHLPVASTGIDTNELHGMIDVMSAGGHDTTSVGAPGGGVNCDGEGASGLDVRGHGGLTALNGLVSGHSQDKLVLVGGAGVSRPISTRGVWVVAVELNAAGSLDVVVSSLLEATVASQGGLVTLNELLL